MGVLETLDNVCCNNRVLNSLFSLRFQVLGEEGVRLDNGGYSEKFLNMRELGRLDVLNAKAMKHTLWRSRINS